MTTVFKWESPLMRQDTAEPALDQAAGTAGPGTTPDVRAVIAEALGLEPGEPAADDDLFELGLDSLTVIRLAGQWRRAGFAVTFEELAEHPTVAQWENLLSRHVHVPGTAAARPAHDPDSREFPLAPMQYAYWVGRQDGQPFGGVGSHFYLEFDGHGLDPQRLQAGYEGLVARHEMLRVRITADGRQWIADAPAVPRVTVHDLRGLGAAERAARLESLRERGSHRRLDVEAGEVCQIAVSLLPGGATRLHVDLDMMVGDAQSLSVLLADLARYVTDLDAGLPALDYDFRRYLADRSAAGGDRRERDAAWWRERLPDLSGAPDLPLRPDAGHSTPQMLRLHHRLDAATTAAFTAAARRHGLTPAAALAAAFAEVVAAWSGSPRFLLNLPLFDREGLHDDVDRLVGDFTGSVLLDADMSAPRAFALQARDVQTRLHAAVGHSAFSGVDVLRELARRAGEPVLAPVVYTSAIGLGAIGDETVHAAFGETVWVSSQNPQVWLDAQVREQGDGLLLNWDARADVLAPGVPEQMFAAYRDLVLRLASGDDAWREPVGALLPAGSKRVRARVNATDRPLSRQGLHEAFFAGARRDPDRPAVLGDEVVGYGELADRALRVAGLLTEHGVRPGAAVAITLPRGPQQVVAVLGVLAAGATYVPVGVDQPPVRRARVLDRAAARVVLTDDEHLAVAGGDMAPAVPLSAAAAAAPLPAPVLVDPDMPAYLLFTSGSTGEPKGVEVPHAAAVNTIASLTARYEIGPDDRSLLVSALDFDLSVFDQFAPLSVGGAVVPLEEGARRDAARWWELVDQHGVTLWNTVPVLLDMLVTAAPGRVAARPPSLRLALVGGDRVSPELPGRLHAVAPGCRFLALGGMTEAAIHSTVLEVPAGTAPDPAWSCVPWGVPLDNVRCRVVDARGRDRPDRVTGELWVGGASLARGYRGDPERTADRFVTAEGTRWYRSGDLARYLPDGTLEFLGRADHQVKVRGHRIELGEIEAALDAHPDVARAVAAVVGDGPARRLAAAVVLRDGADRNAVLDALLGWQEQRLPAAMVCDRVVVLDGLPLTANGKPDRTAVARALTDAAGDEHPSEPPRGPVEQRLAALWADLLRAEGVGRDDSFFALGGDSLLATELMGRLRAAGIHGGRLGALFAAPRLADFAAVLTLDPVSPPDPAAATVFPDLAHRHEPFPPTDVQAAYWVGRDPRFPLGGVGTWQYAEFDGEDVDLDRMARAWRRLVGRHEMLRAVFDADGRQRILPEVPAYEIAVRDVTTEGPEATAEALARLRENHSHRLLDLTRWPLFELAAVRYRQDGALRTRLAIGIDYIIFDALSVMTVFTELDRLYRDPDAQLPPIDVSFRDYLRQVRPDPQAAARDREYWTARLAELPPPPQLPLRTDPTGLVRPWFTRRQRLLPPDAWAALTKRARAEGLTPSTLLLAVYAEVLAAWSTERALTVTLTLFNRRPAHPHIDRVLGDFTSLSPIDHRPTGSGWLQTARELQQRLGADLDHRDVPESWLLRELARSSDTLSSAPVVFTSALGVGAGSVSMDMSPHFPPRIWGVSQSPQVGLDNQVLESGGGLQVTWDAVEELFCAGVLDAMFDAYGRVLDHLAATADGDWDGPLPDLLPAGQREVRDRVNATAADLPAGLLHEPFFTRAAERADDAALVWEDPPGQARTMSHGELAHRALRLAAGLVERGVAPGDAVGITLPKGPDQVVAVLGVLAAGGLYVPVGVDAPPRRREQVHRTAEVRTVVTDVDALLVGDALPAPVPLPSDAPAYVIFTSGSTGAPKGVQVAHAAAANTVADVTARFGVGAGDRVFGISALDFDLSVYDVFGLLGAGGAIVLPAEDERRDATRWCELAAAHGVTMWNSVPVLLEMLLLVGGTAGVPDGLRLALVSGDWVPLDLPRRLAAATGGRARLVALGGATEASIWSNALELDPSGVVPPHWTSVPYGFPLANQCYRVAGPDGRDRPDWVPGELWIGGRGVADGYRGDPARTGEKFVEHAGRRWYRTGDLGRYWPDGTLEFLGRADQQVKVGGHRLELGEVEAALGEHPQVERAAVVAVGPRERRRLHAFLVTATGELPPLDAFLAERLAPHAVPARRTVLDALPLTANGKVDRAALAALAEQDVPPTTDTGQVPDGPVESALAALWAELLELPAPPDREAGFFALGGSSLTALRLVTAVTERFGVEVPIRRFFADPTVAALAAAIVTAQDEEIGTV